MHASKMNSSDLGDAEIGEVCKSQREICHDCARKSAVIDQVWADERAVSSDLRTPSIPHGDSCELNLT